MPSANIQPKHKNINASAFALKDTAFDQTNYRSGGSPQNDTLSVDTPKGVLAASVAAPSDDWEAGVGKHNSVSLLGLFSDNSEGNPFENSPAAASGGVGIYMGCGLFDVFVFETHAALTAYASILASYTIGAALYASLFGLITNELPTAVDGLAGDGVNTILGYVTSVPTASNLKLGLKMTL
jgi:hypothetical protein